MLRPLIASPLIVAIVLAFSIHAPASAQKAQAQNAQALADRLLAQTGAPAIGVGVLTPAGRDVAVTGLRARGGGPVQPGDAWHIGSNGKSMTALLAHRLAAAGRISLNQTLGAALGAAQAGRFAEVTLRDLLAHRGGLPPDAGNRILRSLSGAKRDARADRAVYAQAVLAGRPDRSVTYSNAGYVVAGLLLERAGGGGFEDLIRAEVFGPLGLSSAGFGAPVGGIMGHRRTLFGGRKPVPPGPDADNVIAMSPAGRMHLSLDDHLTYLGAYLDGTAPAPVSPPYDMGWIRAFGGWGHEGSNTLWYSLVWMDPDAGRAIVLNANTDQDVAGAFRKAARAFAGR